MVCPFLKGSDCLVVLQVSNKHQKGQSWWFMWPLLPYFQVLDSLIPDWHWKIGISPSGGPQCHQVTGAVACEDRLMDLGLSLDKKQLRKRQEKRANSSFPILQEGCQEKRSRFFPVVKMWGQEAMNASWNEAYRCYERQGLFYSKESQWKRILSHWHSRLTKPNWKKTWESGVIQQAAGLLHQSCFPIGIIL